MRIDGSSINLLRELQFRNQNGSGAAGAHAPAQDDGHNAATFNLNISGAALPPPPGLEGVFASASTATAASMTELAQSMGAPETTAGAFALEMARRMQGQVDENGEAKDATALANALRNAAEWLRDQHGDLTANAFMAEVLGETGDAASEQSISNGLVKALKLVDENFGIEAGNAAIARFNGELNRELNAYFDNGRNEQFLAATTDASGRTTITAGYARQAAATVADDAQSLTDMLLQESTRDLVEELEEATSPEALSSAKTQRALAAYGFTAQPEPQLLSAVA